MKTLMAVLPAVAISAISPGINTKNAIDYIVFSSLYFDQDSTIVIKTLLSKVSVKVLLSNDLYGGKEIISKACILPGTYTLNYNNEYTRSENKIQLVVTHEKTTITSKKATFNVVSPKYITLDEDNIYTSENECHVFNDKKLWTSYSSTYTFNNFDGLYVADYYHKINLSNFSISMNQYMSTIFKCTPYLIINNYNHIFDDINGGKDSVLFELETVPISNGFTFKLKDDLYVNKSTLFLSSTSKEGYVKTNHIFLPVNMMKDQDKFNARFVFEDFGIGRDFVSHYFSFRALKNTFGDCRNSEYCILREQG